ncbi:hypothetical protein UFOVP1196_40 [uncultured Caudovirales phage]|uniref:Uncharacterized protein n=1 Tax=uncultured Caudovirales phage TaxID=2100421 RepID=A0A6J5RCF0_9CAUD|nr:hypothetical protein UFOVP1196_40 [uncultured Caudovirales phage]
MTNKQKLILWACMDLFVRDTDALQLDLLVQDGSLEETPSGEELHDIVQMLKADLKPSMGHD